MRKPLALIGVLLLSLVSATRASGEPAQYTMTVDVGPTASLAMGPGGMTSLSTGGGPISFNGQSVGTFMHTSQAMTMSGMMGPTFNQRMVTLQFPGVGALFAMIAGGNPWTGAKGIILGGTDMLEGSSGTVAVDQQVSTTEYQFVLTIGP